MEIIYIIVSAILLVSTILIKKSDEKQNLLFWIVTSIVINLCFNVFCSFAVTLVHLKSTLVVLSIVNTVLSIVLLYRIIKKKEIQKYYIKVKDIIVFAILLILVLFIGYKHYGLPIQIKYETTDPAVHFDFAKTYYNTQSTPAGELKTIMPGAYTNTGILFTLFANYVGEINLYKVYIVIDVVMLFLIAAAFYIGLTHKTDSILKTIVAFIGTLIFVFGYPLNSMIFGYQYLSLGILIMVSITSMVYYIKHRELRDIYLIIYMFLLTFGIFFTYYFFVPIMYSAIGLYMLFDFIKNRKDGKNIFSIFTIRNVVTVLVVLIIPTIIGICYFILPGLSSEAGTDASHISSEGYCYRNLYSNFIVFIPFVLFYCIDKLKSKRNNFTTICMIITTIFTAGILYMALTGKASSYYYYKTYFLISILIMQIVVKSIYKLMDNKQGIYGYSFLFVYVAIILACVFNLDGRIANRNFLVNPVSHMADLVDIYAFNIGKLQEDANIYNTEQLKAIKYLKDNGINKEELKIYGNHLQMLWANDLAKITETEDVRELQIPVELDVEGWLKDENKKYYLCLNADEEIDLSSDRYVVDYKDKDVIILKK
ncbi:MAG: hypothetical protein J6M60_04495 [Clostridia bacterium]|nr:hypothetical protein [Clostridia bacterium]